jgi:hypothetical protein
MPTRSTEPVLIIGGSGVVGAQAAKALRRLHPGLPISIGGRDLAKAEAVAREIGHADAVAVDLARADLGQPAGKRYSAVAMFLKDDTMHSLDYAQAHGLPYLSVSSASFEIGPEVAWFIRKPSSAPILMASNWLAGVATFATLRFAAAFERVETIEISLVLDEKDMGGPAAYVDYERITKAAASAQILKNGHWMWATGDDAARRFKDSGGVDQQGQAYAPLDVLSLGAATDARSIRVDLAVGESAARRRGEPFSTEIIIEMTGLLKSKGEPGRTRHVLVHPGGQAPVTAVGVALGIERLLGLAGGTAVAPGLYLPDVLIEPDYALRRLQEAGLQIVEGELA